MYKSGTPCTADGESQLSVGRMGNLNAMWTL